MSQSHTRLIELDSLRGLAALGVAFYHIHPQGTFWMWSLVDLFFVLSGFLITRILLNFDEWSWMNVRNFWIRRVLRIWPVYYLALLVTLLLWWVWSVKHGQGLKPFAGFWESTVFLHYLVGDYANLPKGVNYLWWFGHSWSLAVEEQFYLIWPIFVWKFRNNWKICAITLIGMMMAILWVRSTQEWPPYLLLTRADGLVLGAMIAVLTQSRAVQIWRQEKPLQVRFLTMVLLAASLMVIAPYMWEGYASGQTHVERPHSHLSAGFAAFYGLVVWMVVCELFSGFNALFRNRLLRYFGALSYAIYMFHLPIQKLLDQFYNAKIIPQRWMIEIIFWCLVIGLAEISRRWYESRFERMKSSFPVKLA